jgi:transcriptional regulator with XRE-family HTH domain
MAISELGVTSETEPMEFGELLRFYRVRRGVSRNSLCHEVGCDPSYGTRIEAGDRDPPRRHIVEAFARTLRLKPAERAGLLMAAGYSAWAWSDALQAVADVLSDLDLTLEERAHFRAGVLALAEPWLALARVRR